MLTHVKPAVTLIIASLKQSHGETWAARSAERLPREWILKTVIILIAHNERPNLGRMPSTSSLFDRLCADSFIMDS